MLQKKKNLYPPVSAPKTAEPSAITAWLGHESLSAVVLSLSLLGDTAEVCSLSHLVSKEQTHNKPQTSVKRSDCVMPNYYRVPARNQIDTLHLLFLDCKVSVAGRVRRYAKCNL